MKCLDCQNRLPWADAVEELQKKLQQAAQAASAQVHPSGSPMVLAPANVQRTPAVPRANQLASATASITQPIPQTVTPILGNQTSVNVYETYIGSFLGKFSRGFADVDSQSAVFIGLFFGALYSVCLIIGTYMIRHQVADLFTGMFGGLGAMINPGMAAAGSSKSGSVLGAVTFQGVSKLFALACAQFISFALSSALIRKLFSDEEGSFGGDIFLAGIALMPIGLLLLITGLVGIANWEVTGILSVAALCYTIILLYNGCTIIGRIRDTAAAIAVPLMFLLSGWITKVILTKLLSS